MGQEIINLGTTGAASAGSPLDKTSKTLADFLAAIARPLTYAGDVVEVGALDAFHMALDWLINDHDWEFYFGVTTFASVANTADYVLPVRLKSIFSFRDTTNDRPVYPLRRELWDRVATQNSTGTPDFYTMVRMHSNSTVTLLPTPDAAYNYAMRYLLEPAKPTDTAAVPDVACYMEEPLILRGQGLVTKWRGGQGLLANDLLAMAEAAKVRSISRDHKHHDEDERLVSNYEHGNRWRGLNETDEWWWY